VYKVVLKAGEAIYYAVTYTAGTGIYKYNRKRI
jgi:hypothetical protein